MSARARRGSRAGPTEKPLEYRILLTATLCLLAAGAVMVYSASSARDLLTSGGDGTGYLVKYLLYGTIGLVAMRWLSRHGLAGARRAAPLLLVIALGLTAATLLPGIGVTVNGARRWLGPGPLQFQPSELLKLAIVLYSAKMIAERGDRMRTLGGMVSPLLVVAGLSCGLVAIQPDLGTALVIAIALTGLLLAGGVPVRNLAIIGGIGLGLILLFALLEPYRRARLTSFLNPWAHAGSSGFQAVQGQIALGSGGLFGVGLGQSVQKVFYLPEAHTDFILAVIGEELGVAGVCGVLFLYGMIAYAGLRAAKTAVDRHAKLVAAGVTCLILGQAMLNTFAVLGLAPLTGVPLPFISYGSSSLMVMLAAMGLLLNVAAGGRARLRAVGSAGPRKGRVPTRIVIAAGGTAGHVVPALAVADALRAEGAEVAFVGGERAELELVPAAGYELHRIRVAGLDRHNPLKAARAAGLAAGAARRSVRLLGRLRPDAVLGAGGYVAGPVGLAAVLRRIPLVLSEADSHLGLANRRLAPFARRVCLAFPLPGRTGDRYRVTGRPVPPLVTDRAGARADLGVGSEDTLVLVFGGSLGARSVNEAAVAAYREAPFHVLHVAGARDYAGLRGQVGAPTYDLREYLDLPAFGRALLACDLAVARSGGSVFEIAAYGRPSILVPYPHAAADHQRANARWMADGGAAVVIDDAELTGPHLARTTAELLGDRARLALMRRAALALARPDAARDIARELLAAARRD